MDKFRMVILVAIIILVSIHNLSYDKIFHVSQDGGDAQDW